MITPLSSKGNVQALPGLPKLDDVPALLAIKKLLSLPKVEGLPDLSNIQQLSGLPNAQTPLLNSAGSLIKNDNDQLLAYLGGVEQSLLKPAVPQLGLKKRGIIPPILNPLNGDIVGKFATQGERFGSDLLPVVLKRSTRDLLSLASGVDGLIQPGINVIHDVGDGLRKVFLPFLQ